MSLSFPPHELCMCSLSLILVARTDPYSAEVRGNTHIASSVAGCAHHK